jgi:alanyl-tRNA synthetase
VRTADIDEVGKTTRHGTFFQMNGNFSFGDYFKHDAIGYAWEFITGHLDSGCLALDKSKIWVTVWEDDDEAYARWLEVGLPEEHLQRRDKEENFWSTGGPGPAGPCSEIFFDRGPEFGEEGGPIHDDQVGTERYLEIWNLVFMQWQIDSVKSKYEFNIVGDLKQKNIDTGMGLERVAFLMQDKQNIYEIDEIYPVIEKVEALTGKTYGENHEDDVYMRILADHIRSSMMIIADGVKPSNEGRGYVLRRLMRRCVRSIKLLGFQEPSFELLYTTSFNAMKLSYPELEQQFDKIIEVALAEEKVFARTLTSGSAFLDSAIKAAGKSGIISGSDAFKLHDTHGFPIELTLEIAASSGVKVDEKAFRVAMQEQKDRARQDALAKRGAAVDLSTYSTFAKELAEKLKADASKVVGNNAGISKFLGYDTLEADVKIVGILTKDGPVLTVKSDSQEPVEVEVILNQTPFYAQSGGQLADRGTILTESGALLEVDDVQKPIPELSVHKARLMSGSITLDDRAKASVDAVRRLNIAKAHTSTHIIHKALHEFVGEEAVQAGSENSPGRVRFDFKSSSAIPSSILSEIEERANLKVQENSATTAQIMPIKKAKEIGAMALFSEKYGDNVRVVSLGLSDSDDAKAADGEECWSVELCGGTHVNRVGEIGQIVLLGEGSIGSGVRRVDALVGSSATRFAAREHALVGQISSMLGTKDPDEVAERIQNLMDKLSSAQKREAELAQKAMLEKVPVILESPKMKGDVKYFVYNAGSVSNADVLRSAALKARDMFGESAPGVFVFAGDNDGKAVLIVATNSGARDKKVNAGEIVREISKQLGGGGGGKPDLAQGGGDAANLEAALTNLLKGGA